MPSEKMQIPVGDPAREAIASLGGYAYQIYQSAFAWTELKENELLFLEVVEDYAVVAENALRAVQVKETTGSVTINSDDIVASIDSFVELQASNQNLKVTLRHLTTSTIGKENKLTDRVGNAPALKAWRNLARSGDLSKLRHVLKNSKLSRKSKDFISDLDDECFRDDFLKRIHFDCGATGDRFLHRTLCLKISKLLRDRGGVHSQARSCMANIILSILRLSTNPNRDERVVDRNDLEELLEKFTQVTLNRVQYEEHNQLIVKALSASVPSETNLSNAQLVRPSPVSEIPLPKILVDRTESHRHLQETLETFGVCWISGAAGMGKTIASRVLAHSNKGDWAIINLRGQSSEQVAQVLFQSADSLRDFGLKGLIVDDIAWVTDPNVFDSLLYLISASQRSDVLLVLNSSDLPDNDLLFSSNLPLSITHTLSEFSEEDIQELLEKCGEAELSWAKFIHLVSGGGHPQLAMAIIQSMSASGWKIDILETLLHGSPAVEDVRKRTRRRLLNDMPSECRHLIERISIKTGGFSRELVLDLAKVEPAIPDAGIILETLVGSWVDQHEGNRYSLSPLLVGYASKTLNSDDKKKIESTIAVSLTKGHTLNVIDMNSALWAALSSQNEAVLLKLCVAILGSDFSELEILASHLPMFTAFSTDRKAYPANAHLSYLLRGVQVLLLNERTGSVQEFHDTLRCFAEETSLVKEDKIRDPYVFFFYSMLLLQTSKVGLGPSLLGIIKEVDQLRESLDQSPDFRETLQMIEADGVTAIGFMFLNQVRQLSKIEELRSVFDFLHNISPKFRSKLLGPFTRGYFELDMLVAGVWLREHDNGTIELPVHSAIFARLEEQADNWGETHLAVCCRKYRAFVLDEYGSDRNGALSVLDDGLLRFGRTNPELMCAKAKVLYRSEDHKGSLELSKELIEDDAPLSDVEKAFLGRNAAISAEKQGDFQTARRFYLYGSDAAKKLSGSDMAALRVGLLADAALASWHGGDRFTCLQDFVAVLSELNQFNPADTLRTAHCHAVARHVLLWLYQEATGEKCILEDGKEPEIYPGCVSNPEPHAEIGQHYIAPIDIAWYILATVENYLVLDAGITENLDHFLPNGPLLEGQSLLGPAKMHKALSRSDAKLFVAALRETIALYSFRKSNGVFDPKNVTCGTLPTPTVEQQENIRNQTEQFVLTYFVISIFRGKPVAEGLRELTDSNGFSIRPVLLDRIQGEGPAEDINTKIADLIFSCTSGTPVTPSGSPQQVFELAFKTLQITHQTKYYILVAQALRPWLKERWEFILERQRFLLSHPALYDASISAAMNDNETPDNLNVVNILQAVLPTLGIGNQSEIERILSDLL